MIKLSGVRKVYRTRQIETRALDNVNIQVPEGQFVAIMGPSGCGKSTLLNIMGLLDGPTAGSVEIAGIRADALKDLAMARFRNENLGFVFQSFYLIPQLNVLQNVMVPLQYRGDMSASQRRELAAEALHRVGLDARLRHYPRQLSGGQSQRVAIARAIVGNPKIILADEPTGNLDSRMGQDIMDLLHGLNQREGRTIVMVTHNERQAKAADRIIRFFDGRQVQ
ncbi:MAG: ABC transporter ATP-binding protein [Bacteroidales bacterium]|nr:ABC transporter ATP-binding protein [Bacteroidales bacterium]